MAAGEVLQTPTGRASFTVDAIDSDGVVLLFGPKKTATHFNWDCLEGVPKYLQERGWILVGANRILPGTSGTLDGYMKKHVPRQTANCVAAMRRLLFARGLVRRRGGTR